MSLKSVDQFMFLYPPSVGMTSSSCSGSFLTIPEIWCQLCISQSQHGFPVLSVSSVTWRSPASSPVNQFLLLVFSRVEAICSLVHIEHCCWVTAAAAAVGSQGYFLWWLAYCLSDLTYFSECHVRPATILPLWVLTDYSVLLIWILHLIYHLCNISPLKKKILVFQIKIFK